eukprot:gene1975-2657_t
MRRDTPTASHRSHKRHRPNRCAKMLAQMPDVNAAEFVTVSDGSKSVRDDAPPCDLSEIPIVSRKRSTFFPTKHRQNAAALWLIYDPSGRAYKPATERGGAGAHGSGRVFVPLKLLIKVAGSSAIEVTKIFPQGKAMLCIGLFDKLRRRKRNVDGGVLAGLGRTKDFGGTRFDTKVNTIVVCAVKRGWQVVRNSFRSTKYGGTSSNDVISRFK